MSVEHCVQRRSSIACAGFVRCNALFASARFRCKSVGCRPGLSGIRGSFIGQARSL